MNKLLPKILILVLIVGVGYLLLNKSSSSIVPRVDEKMSSEKTADGFEVPKKSAHYESNTPAHGSTLAGVPLSVVIDFNFDLAPPSEIKIEKDGKDYGVEETVIDDNKLAMRRNVDPTSPDGLYKVTYNACWPDGSCHDGHFQFKIDKSTSSTYEDLTGQKEVTVNMSEIKFKPMNIKVSKGTKITWVNDDDVDHYVNTETHPAHTYYPEQNSRALKKGESHSTTFDIAGIYPYHCSAHADSMTGSLLVE